MNITLMGVRGSIPTTSPDTQEYGGDTSCTVLEEEGWLLVLDAGSGIRKLEVSGHMHNRRVDILLTHLHIDHIQGLGFFRPLFDPSIEVHIWGPSSNVQSLRARLGRYLSPPLFPVYFRDLSCQLFLHEVANSTFRIGPFLVESRYVVHPGPTVGFRVQGPRGVLTYIPDHEPALGPSGLVSDTRWLSGSDLAAGADLLLHDAQYTQEEYKVKVGWGHSSQEDALRFAGETGVKHLLLTHHDPARTDAQLHLLFQRLQQTTCGPCTFEMAVEGKAFEL